MEKEQILSGKRNKTKEVLFLIIMFLFAFGIGNAEKLFVGFFAVYFALKIISKRFIQIKSKGQVLPLALWGMLYSLMSMIEGNDYITTIVYYFIAPVVLCALGYEFFFEECSEDSFNKYIFVISFGFFLHAVLSIINSINAGLFKYNAEYIQDFWNGRMISRTIMGMYMVPVVCYAIPRLLSRISAIRKVLLIIMIVVPVLLSIYVGNRALLVIVLVLAAVSYMFGYKMSSNKLRFLFTALMILSAVIICVALNVMGIREFINSSFLASRTKSLRADSRFVVYLSVMKDFTKYLLGWISSGGGIIGETGLVWAHNIWIDVFVYSGLLPLIFFIDYSIRVIKDTIRASRKKSFSLETRLCIIAFLVGVFLEWAVEPVLQSNPYFVSACCFIFGMISRMGDYGNKYDY